MQLEALHRRVIMDARVIHEAVNTVFPAKMPKQYQGRAFNLSAFLRRLNATTESLGVVNDVVAEKKIPKNTVLMTAQWLPEDCLPVNGSSADVRLEWNINTQSRRQTWTQKEWSKRRFYFWSYLMHELIHRHQDMYRGRMRGQESFARVYRARVESGILKEEQIYLGDYDEIEAHAHDVALEMRMWYPGSSYRDALVQMKMQAPPRGAITCQGSSTYVVYTRAFATTPKHPALSVFHRKIKTWWHLMGAQPDFYQSLHLETSWR
jgi:hypothetical protein